MSKHADIAAEAGALERQHSLFTGVPHESVEHLLARLERRTFRAGSIVLAPEERLDGIYIVVSGSAEVLVPDHNRKLHHIGFVHAGETIGEMALLTGMHGGATLRARSDIDLFVMRRREFERAAQRFPQLYHNIGTMLAARLARTDQLAAEERHGRLFMLEDRGAPALLGYAIACSLAWHTRSPTVLVVLDESPAPELAGLVRTASARTLSELLGDTPARGAHVLPTAQLDQFEPEAVAELVEGLFHHFDYVLVQGKGPPPRFETARPLRLVGESGGADDDDLLVVGGWRPARARLGADATGVVPVPHPERDDLERLQEGLLSLEGHFGRALGWVARDLAGMKVGLAFGAGSIRGFAHCGVLKVLERAGVPVDYVAGTSVGSIVATTYALGFAPEQIVDALAKGPVFRLAFPFKSLLSIRPLEAYVRRLGAGRRFEDTDVPAAVVAADLVTQKEVVFRRGELAAAVVASISIPGIYPAQRVGTYTLVDGGVINPVPTSVLAEMGAGRAIAVKLGVPPIEREPDAEAVAGMGMGPRPSAIATMLHAIEVMQTRIAVETRLPTVFVTPEFGHLPTKLRNFAAGRRFVEAGEQAAEEALTRLATALPWIARPEV